MRTNPDYILREIMGESVLIPCGESAKIMNGLINLNDTAAFIWKNLDEAASVEELAKKIVSEYEVEEERAVKETGSMLEKLVQAGLVLDD